MITRSMARKMAEEEAKPKLLKYLMESPCNYYYGQCVCTMRDADLETDFNQTDEADLGPFLQSIYDLGCATLGMGIVHKDGSLNTNFGDYEDWKFAADRVENNCRLLRELGHHDFQ